MNSVVIKYLFVQFLAWILREAGMILSKTYHTAWSKYRKYIAAIRDAEFTLKDFVIETLLGLVEMEDFEDVEELELIKASPAGRNDVAPNMKVGYHINESGTNNRRPSRRNLKRLIKKLLRAILLPLIEQCEHERKLKGDKNRNRRIPSGEENRFRSEWSP